MTFTIAEPTTAASAKLQTFDICAAVDMPNPTAIGSQ
jgi:hypothetical protein